jgi:hypothetical protein
VDTLPERPDVELVDDQIVPRRLAELVRIHVSDGRYGLELPTLVADTEILRSPEDPASHVIGFLDRPRRDRRQELLHRVGRHRNAAESGLDGGGAHRLDAALQERVSDFNRLPARACGFESRLRNTVRAATGPAEPRLQRSRKISPLERDRRLGRLNQTGRWRSRPLG